MLIAVESVQDAPESALAVTVSFAQPTYAHPFEVGVAVAEVEVVVVCATNFGQYDSEGDHYTIAHSYTYTVSS
jgi:hypothetical protein